MLLDPPPPERTAVTRSDEGLDSPLPVWLAQAASAEADGDTA
jgi:hypothetical protein